MKKSIYVLLILIIVIGMLSGCDSVTKEKGIKVGQYVTFGTYEQDNDLNNGKEDIEWRVLEVKDGKALVISRYVLDRKNYSTSISSVDPWKYCFLREWLNDSFINLAFSEEEKARIQLNDITEDRVFLLDESEVEKYFNSQGARQCKFTDYAFDQSIYKSSICNWWLRSSDIRTAVLSDGSIRTYDRYFPFDDYGVRPALWIDFYF